MPQSETVDRDLLLSIGVPEIPGQADGWLQGSLVGPSAGSCPLRLPLREEEVTVGGAGLAILKRRVDVHGSVMNCTFAQPVCSFVSLHA